MVGWLWGCLMLIKVDLRQLPIDTFPPTSQQTLLPYPNIMIGTEVAGELGEFIFDILLCHILAQSIIFIGGLAILTQIDVWMALGLSNVDQS